MKSLLESIRNMYASEATMMQDDGKTVHNCAKHVEHAEYGRGNTIAEEHADPDRYGNIAWYDVVFEHGVEKGVPVTELKVVQSESHMHSTKKAKKVAEGNVNAPVSIDPKQDIKKKAMDAALAAANQQATGAAPIDAIVKQGAKKIGEEKMDDDDDEMEDDDVKAAGHKKTKEKYQTMDKMPGVISKEDIDAVDEVMNVFHRTSPGADMKRYPKDSPAPEAAAHRNAAAAAVKGLRATGALKRKSFAYGSTDDIKTPKGGTVMAMKREEFDADFPINEAWDQDVPSYVDETIIAATKEYDISEAKKSTGYDAHFRAMMTKHGVKHPGELDTQEKKKAFFNKVDASYKAKNEDVFLEAMLASDLQKIKDAHKNAGNKISNETSGSKAGQAHHSFVVTQPSGKRTRHIYHGSTKKVETMSPAPRSKDSTEQDLDDK